MEEREISLYDELNIREDATTAEVKQAYRRLSAVFHPDKQQDESLKEEAAVSFTKIKDAYEVTSLGSPVQRRELNCAELESDAFAPLI